MLGLVPAIWAAPVATTTPTNAGFAAICIAFGLVAALPISFANYPADYMRYLPRQTSGSPIVFWNL